MAGRSCDKTGSMERAHDYKWLIARWRCVTGKAGLRLQRFALSSGRPVYFIRTQNGADPRTIHLSGGIHGDEPAGAEALISWAEKNLRRQRRYPFLIFPCLNPWGLLNNSRHDEHGCDLNREFGVKRGASPVRELKRLIRGEKFALSLTLHEDYEAEGLYLYEIKRDRPYWGEELLEIARPLIPIEPRRVIDGRRAHRGLIRRRLQVGKFPLMPEAIYLHIEHSRRTFTIETPSECSLETRVAAQVAIIEECVRRVMRKAKS